MYSLYRAWLSLGPNGGLPGTLPSLSGELHGPPGLCYASPHTNGSPDVTLQVGPGMTHFSAHKNILSAHSGFFKAVFLNHAGSNPISVPNVNVDEFSSLLTFMYTGFLDLNYANIYNILLATHILHMPRALEICRSFLIQHHPAEAPASTTAPASTIIKPIPSRKSALPHQQIFAPLFGNLQKSEGTPFRAIGAEEKPQPAPRAATTTTTTATTSCHDAETRKLDGQEPKKLVGEKKARKRDEGEKVVVDVACCDGPVRFHRVLNKNYGLKNLENDFCMEQIDRNVLLNKAMIENIRDKRSETENQLHPGGGGATGSDMFTCVYCNHTFKSQYCYQKHARRHLNPVNLEVKSIQKVENFVSSKREVKLLDMNVQYYPCKTCGSKFPSYYFVHKHRKMCHADELGDASVKSGETEEKPHNENNSESRGEDEKNNDDSEIEVENDN